MCSAARTPASLRVRAAARQELAAAIAGASAPGNTEGRDRPLILVALSGGADSLALTAALATVAPAIRVRCGAVIVDHGLQRGSAAVAANAADQARALGLDPVLVRRVTVSGHSEAAARSARYEVLRQTAEQCGAIAVCTAHTRDDQAEQVLLALTRGSGTRSLAGIPSHRALGGSAAVSLLRPLLDHRTGVTRQVTVASCAELGLTPWVDPHNTDTSYARVRVRTQVLPVIAQQLGSGAIAALARSADLAREDADALDDLARDRLREIRSAALLPHAATLPTSALAKLPAAVRHRIIRLFAAEHFGRQLGRTHTLAIAALVTDWRGQGPSQVPGGVVHREHDLLVFTCRGI